MGKLIESYNCWDIVFPNQKEIYGEKHIFLFLGIVESHLSTCQVETLINYLVENVDLDY